MVGGADEVRRVLPDGRPNAGRAVLHTCDRFAWSSRRLRQNRWSGDDLVEREGCAEVGGEGWGLGCHVRGFGFVEQDLEVAGYGGPLFVAEHAERAG